MEEDPRVAHGDEREALDDVDPGTPEDPTVATNESNVGMVSGMTGPVPLTGGQIVRDTTDDPDPLI